MAKKALKKKKQKKKKLIKPIRSSVSKQAKSKDGEEGLRKTRIRIVSVGGGGGNIISEISKNVRRVDFVAANTDVQAQKSLARNVRGFAFGSELTNGLGCGMDVSLGEAAARAEKDRIKKLFEGQDITILVASLGGGTGCGAMPVFAEAAKEAKSLTIGIFTMPFSFEGEKRMKFAEEALEKLKPLVNAYVIIPNENIFHIIDAKTPLKESLSALNKRLAESLEGFIETLSLPGLINIDFADIRSILEGRGRLAYINTVVSSGAAKAQSALKEVLANPLYDYSIEGVDRILFNVSGDKNLKMHEVAEISKAVSGNNTKAKIIFGISIQPEFRDKMRIVLFAVGCKQGDERQKKQEKLEYSETKAKKAKPKAQKKESTKKQRKLALKRPVKSVLPQAPESNIKKERVKTRRSALDLKKAQDDELQEIEKEERQWDTPSFLRNNKSIQ